MDQFLKDLQNELNQQPETEHLLDALTLHRLIEANKIFKFYDYLKAQNFSGSICYYMNEYSAWINTNGVSGCYEGHGQTITDALNDLMSHLNTRRQ